MCGGSDGRDRAAGGMGTERSGAVALGIVAPGRGCARERW